MKLEREAGPDSRAIYGLRALSEYPVKTVKVPPTPNLIYLFI